MSGAGRTAAELPARRLAGRLYRPDGFAVLRTPLLPMALGQVADEEAALPVTERLRRRRRVVAEVYRRPEAREALFLGSPDLADRLDDWLRDPDGAGADVELALVRYFQRMTCRPTPFGLFAACTLVPVGPTQDLRLAGADGRRRVSRLDMDYLDALLGTVVADADIRPRLRFVPNDSIYRVAGRLRYVESRAAERGRTHHLVSVVPDPYLDAALAAAEGGAEPARIAAAVRAVDTEVSAAEAETYVGELIASGLLVPELRLPVTGEEPLPVLLRELDVTGAAAPVVAALTEARDLLREADRGGVGQAPALYDRLATRLAALPVQVDRNRLVQVDLWREPAPGAMLSSRVVAEVLRGVDLLQSLGKPPGESHLQAFVRVFRERYGEREVPLAAVLDEDVGIGFQKSHRPSAGASPLLAQLHLPGPRGETTLRLRPHHRFLLERLEETLRDGGREIVLQESELRRFAVPDPPPLPDAFAVMFTVIGAPGQEPGRDDDSLRLIYRGASGPSGARLLGRFCHLDSGLADAVRSHLRREEALQPDAVLAEIVHLPEGRVGNILFRPLLRDHEIPYLGRSGVPPENRIPLADLLVSVRGDRVVLRSRRLGKEIVPRLTTAHNFVGRSTGVYRFLGLLQSQGTEAMPAWDWGPLQEAPFLPRVRVGRLVLSLARWRVTAEEIRELAAVPDPAARDAAVAAWAERRGLPRRVEVVEADNTLAVDLADPLAAAAMVDLLRRHRGGVVQEWLPASTDRLAVTGPDGGYRHELVVPVVRVPDEGERRKADAPVAPAGRAVPRSFAPGGPWLFAALYCGEAAADEILRRTVEPLARRWRREGVCDRWFFIRYSDPHWHLRLRFHGDPQRLAAVALPELHAACRPLLESGLAWRLALETYEREVERYGGPDAMAVCEELFHHDSEAALDVLQAIGGDTGEDARWLLALLGTHRLLGDLGFPPPAALPLCERMRDGYLREFPGGKVLKKDLGRIHRERRDLLSWLLWDAGEPPAGELGDQLAAGRRALAARSEQWAGAAARLRKLAEEGRLAGTLGSVAGSLAHMHANRLLRSAARAHELVIHDLLVREYRSWLARQAGP